MKLRYGFVSNSSSASFLLYGWSIPTYDSAPVWLDLNAVYKHYTNKNPAVDIDTIDKLCGEIHRADLDLLYGNDTTFYSGWYNLLIGIMLKRNNNPDKFENYPENEYEQDALESAKTKMIKLGRALGITEMHPPALINMRERLV